MTQKLGLHGSAVIVQIISADYYEGDGMAPKDDIRKLINSYNSRLQELRKRRAIQGISTPPEILIEIEDLVARIAELSAELSAERDYKLVAVRNLLSEAFSDEELTELVFDEFPPVYENFSRGMSKHEKIHRLIEYCDRRLLMPNLLMAVRQRNPSQYFLHEDELFLEEPSRKATKDERIAQIVIAPEVGFVPLDNPYVVGNPIQPDNTKVFLGRFDIAQSIVNEIKREGQKPSMLLYGRRRMGKTSALLNISRLIRDRSIIAVYTSGQSVRFHTNVDFCYYLVQAIYEKLQQNHIDADIFRRRGFLAKAVFVPNPVLTLSEFFEECDNLLEFHKKHCLLSIDEYEEIDQHINTSPGNHHERNITRELLLELRDTLQHRPRFMFLFAGTHFLRDLSTVNWAEIFINVKTLHISFLRRGDGYKLLTEPVPELRYESANLIEQILDMTGCQPFLLQAVASELINALNSNDTKTATRKLLDRAIEGILDKHSPYFDYIWDTECTSAKHRNLLKLIATTSSGVSRAKLTAYLYELRDLTRKEVLKIEGGLVKLTMPVVKLWMEKNQHIL